MRTVRQQPAYTQKKQVIEIAKQEPLIKSFQKKYRGTQIGTSLNQTADLTLNYPPLQSQRNRSKSPLSRRSPIAYNLLTGRKQEKPGLVQKVNLNSITYQQLSLTSATHKMRQVNRLFLSHPVEDPRLAIQNLYFRNEQYMLMLSDWQKQQIYDENDRLIYKLIQYFIDLVSSIYQSSASQLANLMGNYEETLRQLERCEGIYEDMRRYQDYGCVLEEEVWSERDKNQWSTLIFNALSRDKFDLQGYVKTLPQFKNGEVVSRKNQAQEMQATQEVNIIPCSNVSAVVIQTKLQKQTLQQASRKASDLHSLNSECTNIKVPEQQDILAQY